MKDRKQDFRRKSIPWQSGRQGASGLGIGSPAGLAALAEPNDGALGPFSTGASADRRDVAGDARGGQPYRGDECGQSRVIVQEPWF